MHCARAESANLRVYCNPGESPYIEKIEDFRDALRKAAPINEQMHCDSRARSAKRGRNPYVQE